MRNIKWIFFDMGSTLIDESAAMRNSADSVACLHRWEKQAKIKMPNLSANRLGVSVRT